ncbi:hypothetical protein PPACK8108_LOCUS20791 [Phakopsora pachyrhizi]|uniref:Uncharacterized protein n=1 Tax=Phakopsora pachyrhizi TaxID=170000 RepID=A0AAV0BHP3_PHAPC|nr:hypothetical protein PPACK8108_LOCUS20791 [Phakopsora pachyrhizi]
MNIKDLNIRLNLENKRLQELLKEEVKARNKAKQLTPWTRLIHAINSTISLLVVGTQINRPIRAMLLNPVLLSLLRGILLGKRTGGEEALPPADWSEDHKDHQQVQKVKPQVSQDLNPSSRSAVRSLHLMDRRSEWEEALKEFQSSINNGLDWMPFVKIFKNLAYLRYQVKNCRQVFWSQQETHFLGQHLDNQIPRRGKKISSWDLAC